MERSSTSWGIIVAIFAVLFVAVAFVFYNLILSENEIRTLQSQTYTIITVNGIIQKVFEPESSYTHVLKTADGTVYPAVSSVVLLDEFIGLNLHIEGYKKGTIFVITNLIP